MATKSSDFEVDFCRFKITGAFPVNAESVPVNTDIPDGWQSTEHLKEENGERLAFERLR